MLASYTVLETTIFYMGFPPLLPNPPSLILTCMSPAEDPKGKTRQRRTPLWHPWGPEVEKGEFFMTGFKGILEEWPMIFRAAFFFRKQNTSTNGWWNNHSFFRNYRHIHQCKCTYGVFWECYIIWHSFPKSESMAVATTVVVATPVHNAFQTFHDSRSLFVPHIKNRNVFGPAFFMILIETLLRRLLKSSMT